MSVALDFTEEQLRELWTQHTSLEDDPRDANHDLRVAFEDDDSLRQQLHVAPDGEPDMPEPIDQPLLRATYVRVRATREASWSLWARVS